MFIAFEGIDGSGKTTHARALAMDMPNLVKGQTTLTREPSDASVELGTLRNLLLNNALTPKAAMFAFLASREMHVEQIIKPRLAAGESVITDRYHLSTLAYQDIGFNLNLLPYGYYGFPVPDLTFILDITESDMWHRLAERHDTQPVSAIEKYMKENPTYLKRVREAYIYLGKTMGFGRHHIVNSSCSYESVRLFISTKVREFLLSK